MKNTKINFEQLKKLVTESIGDVIDNADDQKWILSDIEDISKKAQYYNERMQKSEEYRQTYEQQYEQYVKHLIKRLEDLKNFDVVAL